MTVTFHEQWLDTTFTTTNNIQLFTALKQGGFGFTSALHIKDTAFVASWQQVAPAILRQTGHPTFGDLLQHLPNTQLRLQHAVNNIDPALWETLTELTPESKTPKHVQKKLTTLLRNLYNREHTNSLDARGMSVHYSTCGEGAGSWLHAPTLDITPLTNKQFSIAAKIRLDKPHVPLPTPCTLTTRNDHTNTCNHQDNIHLDHALTCKYGSHRIRRHNALRDTLAKIIHQVTGHRPLIEQAINKTPPPPNTPLPPDTPDTPINRSDITLSTVDTDIHIDVMVTSATTATALAGTTNASATPGHASTLAELYKRGHYHPLPITPAILEVHGRFGPTLLQFLRQLTATLPTPQERTTTYHHALQQLATTLQRANAITLLAHSNTSATLATTATAPTVAKDNPPRNPQPPKRKGNTPTSTNPLLT